VPTATEVRVTAGGGVRGCVEGHRVEVGKLSWLAACGIELPAASAVEPGSSAVAIAIDGRLAGELVLDDPGRPEALDAMLALGRMEVSCHLLSGDRPEVVARVAGSSGLAGFAGGLSPTDKPLRVRALRASRGLVAMVGDGVNDAPALATADVGIAIGAGTDVAVESAGIVLVRSDPRDVVGAIELSRASYRKMVQNLVWATGYNLVAIPVAAGVLVPWGINLPMAVGAIAMSASTIIVAANAQLLRGLRLRRQPIALEPQSAPA
jgi:Cu2+-exporting ATPase